ncbi:hypothetical protein AcetOrient_orf00475 [Acetobacter orientalis]|uniref:Uncharacterized protein n=1 Tax=Acetobacter orientalis TaxID=146474 RepID=A0A2Z5ZE12_9PROT|nr:hypothetical protein AcetOrient_orf00475 [Acetobacter orientalis]
MPPKTSLRDSALQGVGQSKILAVSLRASHGSHKNKAESSS